MSDTTAIRNSAARKLAELYEPDETAWLDESSRCIRAGRVSDLDYENLASWLEDDSARRRRRVRARVCKLLALLLVAYVAPKRRSRRLRKAIADRRRALTARLTPTLRRHVEDHLADCYALAARLAAISTDLPRGDFPAACPLTLAQIVDDKVAWLDEAAHLIRAECGKALDWPILADYLEDMAKRDRREIGSRLRILLAHLLKWQYQPAQRCAGWQITVLTQRAELESGMTATLRHHAEAVLPKVYRRAVQEAAKETGLDASTFPAECPYTLDQILTEELA
jgi:hypothetical protein